MVTFFDFFGFSKNPIVAWCLSYYNEKTVLTLEDCLSDIMKLKYARFCYENNFWSYIGDELRLYYASVSDDFTYIDADCIVKNPELIKMDCCAGENGNFNEGSFFRANKNTAWVKHYLEVYEKSDFKEATGNFIVHSMSPFPVLTQDLERLHLYASLFNSFPKTDRIYYTRDKAKAIALHKPVWLFDGNCGRVTNFRVFHTTEELPFELFKEQLRYSQKNPDLTFEEI